jgi:hypothetical protein
MNEKEVLENYVAEWSSRLPELVKSVKKTDTEELEEKMILHLHETYLPLASKRETKIFDDGYILLKKKPGLFAAKDGNFEPSYSSGILDPQLLNEIIAISKMLDKEESCYESMMDGYHSELTMFNGESANSITNYNCKLENFSLSYRKLIMLIRNIGKN